MADTPKRVNIHHTPDLATTTSRHGSMALSGTSTHGSSAGAGTPFATASSAKRLYRSADNKWVTRDIASLDFLLGIPLAAEQDIVSTGWQLQCKKDDEEISQSSNDEGDIPARSLKNNQNGDIEAPPPVPKGTWWGKWIQQPSNLSSDLQQQYQYSKHSSADTNETAELERPTQGNNNTPGATPFLPLQYAPGRRLEGDEAVRVQIPITMTDIAKTKQKSIARQAALREWELSTAHGLKNNQPPMLDGRLFFSCNSSYPVSVFSVIRYEPSKFCFCRLCILR